MTTNKNSVAPIMTPERARHLSKLVPSRRQWPDENKRITSELFDYYRALLWRAPAPIPTPRRWL